MLSFSRILFSNARGLRRWLICGNVAICSLLVGGSLWSLRHSRESDLQAAVTSAENLAATSEGDLGAELRLVDNTLQTLAFRNSPTTPTLA